MNYTIIFKIQNLFYIVIQTLSYIIIIVKFILMANLEYIFEYLFNLKINNSKIKVLTLYEGKIYKYVFE